jgi:hypothetical protein
MQYDAILSARVAVAIVLSVAPSANSAVLFDLSGDWSDTNNPNGPWTYNGTGGVPLTIHRDDWDSTTNIHFSSPQPAWTDTDGNTAVPAWFKSTGATAGTFYNLDFPVGRTGMHGPPDLTAPGLPLSPNEFSSVTWTSPSNGFVNISGGVWLMRKSLGRSMDWTLRLNGVSLSGGSLTSTDSFTSSNPFKFLDGNGGPSVLNVAVSTGDVVALELGRPTSDNSHEFVGVDFSILAVPEASSFILWCGIVATVCFAAKVKHVSQRNN